MSHIELRLVLFIAFISMANIVSGQVAVSGYISDKETGERLLGAYITSHNNAVGAVTDNNGFFSMTIQPPTVLIATYVGYTKNTISINTPNDTLVSIQLMAGELLNEVVVIGKKEHRVGLMTLKPQEMLAMPVLGSKPDVLKVLETKPGILSQHEGSSLIQVRGGDPGQNMYLLDGIPLINVYHVGGFMSVFNPDNINGLDLYTGAFPAKYGGRISSIVDISQREGDKNSCTGNLSIGVTDLSGIIEGPAMFKNSSFIVSARKTVLGELLMFATIPGELDPIDYVGFHDINAKLSWRPSEKHSLFFNLYQGDDYSHQWTKKSDSNNGQRHTMSIRGNWLASARWLHVSAGGLTGTQTLSLSRYRIRRKNEEQIQTESGLEDEYSIWKTTIADYTAKSLWKYKLNSYFTTEFGGSISLLRHNPPYTIDSQNPTLESRDVNWLHVSSFFVDNIYRIGSRFTGNAGLLATLYNNGNYHTIKPEPRLTGSYSITDQVSINASYMQTYQYNHLVMNGYIGLIEEIWLAADSRLKPSTSKIGLVGILTSMLQQNIDIELNAYLKKMNNLVAAPIGYFVVGGDEHFADKVLNNGVGKAYGTEFLLSKKSGKLTGSIAYTYSKTYRKFQKIMDNNWVVSDYDRPHSFNATFSYKLNKRISISAGWNFSSGQPYTPIVGRYYMEDPNEPYGELKEAFLFGDRNSARMKDYHRLDLSVQWESISKRGNKTLWTFSVYNAYNRKNPTYYYYNSSGGVDRVLHNYNSDEYLDIELYQRSTFPILPSVSYKVFFDGYNYRQKKAKGKVNVFRLIKDWATYQ